VLDPEAATRPAPAHAPPPGAFTSGEASSHALQILTTEHWSLLTSRSLGYTEAMARGTLFISALAGAVVALALVSQAASFDDGFVAFALVLLPVVYFLGVVTVARIAQINGEDARWVQGLNRLRHAYLEIAPELEPYFVTSPYDDAAGVVWSTVARAELRTPVQPFIALPGLIAVVDSVVAGATVGIGMLGLGLGDGASLAIGAAAFVASLAGFLAFAMRTIASYRRTLDVRFPTPPADV
jgi:hypothetical protein